MLGAVLRNLQQLQQQLHHLGPSATAALQAVAKSPGIAIGCAGGLGSAGTASLARFASLSNLTAWPCTAWPSEHDLLRCFVDCAFSARMADFALLVKYVVLCRATPATRCTA